MAVIDTVEKLAISLGCIPTSVSEPLVKFGEVELGAFGIETEERFTVRLSEGCILKLLDGHYAISGRVEVVDSAGNVVIEFGGK